MGLIDEVVSSSELQLPLVSLKHAIYIYTYTYTHITLYYIILHDVTLR